MELNTTEKACWHRLGRVESSRVSRNKTTNNFNSTNSRRTRQNPHKHCPCVSGSPRTWTWQGSRARETRNCRCNASFPFLPVLTSWHDKAIAYRALFCLSCSATMHLYADRLFNFFCNILGGLLLSARTSKWRKKEKRKILCLTSLVHIHFMRRYRLIVSLVWSVLNARAAATSSLSPTERRRKKKEKLE